MQTDYQNLVDLLDEWTVNYAVNEDELGDGDKFLFVDMFDNEGNVVCGFEFDKEGGSFIDVCTGHPGIGYDIIEVARKKL